jgi:hypothetical protein
MNYYQADNSFQQLQYHHLFLEEVDTTVGNRNFFPIGDSQHAIVNDIMSPIDIMISEEEQWDDLHPLDPNHHHRVDDIMMAPPIVSYSPAAVTNNYPDRIIASIKDITDNEQTSSSSSSSSGSSSSCDHSSVTTDIFDDNQFDLDDLEPTPIHSNANMMVVTPPISVETTLSAVDVTPTNIFQTTTAPNSRAADNEDCNDDGDENDDDDDDDNMSLSFLASNQDSRFKPFHSEKWNIRYKELLYFFEQHGHAAVPHTYKPNEQLARWVKVR